MKTPKLLFLFTFLWINAMFAQYEPYNAYKTRHFDNNWSFGVGVNVVDDAGYGLNDMFDIKKNRQYRWAFETPITLSAEYHFDAEFSINTTAAFNKFKSGKSINNQIVDAQVQPNYFALDLSVKYSFRVLLKSKVLDPYASIGLGYVSIQDYYIEPNNTMVNSKDRIVSNPSLGLNIWFAKNWALNMHAIGKLTYTPDTSHLLQYGVGVVHLLNKKR